MLNQVSNYFELDLGAWQLTDVSQQSFRVIPKRKSWSGYGDYHFLNNGLLLGRGDIYNGTGVVEESMPFRCFFGIHILIDANYDLTASNLKQTVSARPKQIWGRYGNFGEICTTWQENSRQQVVSLDFPEELLLRWQEDFALPDWLNLPKHGMSGDDGGLILLSDLPIKPALILQALRIINQPTETLTDSLTLESLALSLCGRLLSPSSDGASSSQTQTMTKKSLMIKNKVDDAIDIIHAEYHLPLTISGLARQVGINECYLKQGFKERTGQTIATYIRQLRLQQALRLLLDEGMSVQQTAYYVGYRDVGHFSQIFKKEFGYLPSEL
ncbi:helix-turn-helix transcriptional regulator [Psychrobacter sp. I-STPA10]|uniref:helix-turn-helix transcriptional regulator n=1 Tax=Psychrobacter sp. I-STPA10 TaxID=2585769 RepID=UPI001E543924|nr:AraC family transcriptional regulator [Psychrobacter sp. I-STPA10]